MPPVSRTWPLSARVVATPPTVMVTVGATVTGVQLLLGYPLVSKLSEPGVLAGRVSGRVTLFPAGTANEPHRLLNSLPPVMEEWISAETLPTGIAAVVLLSSLIAPAS